MHIIITVDADECSIARNPFLEYANNCLANKVLKQTKISILAIELILSLFKL